MSTRVESLRVVLDPEIHADLPRIEKSLTNSAPSGWSPEGFAAEQIRGLVQQVFFPSDSRACRQVVFSAVDAETEIGDLCLEVGRLLATHTHESVCLVDSSPGVCGIDEVYGRKGSEPISDYGGSGALRDSSRQISNRLWLVPSEMLWGGREAMPSADVLGRHLDQLRDEFDYCVIQAPAAGTCGSAGLLGRLGDGLVLVLEANSTRRLAALRAHANLRAANAKLLGVVLSQRTFPIPERIYRSL